MKIDIDLQMIQNMAVDYGVKIVSAILIFIIGKWIAKRITKVLAKILEKQDVDVTLIKFLNNIIYYLLLTAVLVAVAGQLGINTASFLTIIGAAGLAIGLALKDSLSNFSAGVMLILFRPFKVGDNVVIAGEAGKVEEVSVFCTVLNTPDNQKKIIPNSAISSGTIINVTANPTRRVDLIVGIGYDDDIRKAKETLEEICAAEALVLKDPEPTIAVSSLGASSVDLVVRPWVKTDDYWDAYFALTEKIKLVFDEKSISFPFPQQDVHMYTEQSD